MASNWTRKLEAIVKPVVLVIILLVSFIFMAKSEAEMRVEVGMGMLSGDWSNGVGLLISEKIGDGKYSVGLGYLQEQEVVDRHHRYYDIDENLFVQAQRHVMWKKLEISVGAAYFNATNRALGSNFTAALGVHYNFSDSLSLGFRHYSNAGSGTPNMGQDILMVGWRF